MSVKLGNTAFSKAYVGSNHVDKIAMGSSVIYYGLVTSNLKIHIDAENTDSYPGSGDTITDLQGNHDAELVGTFNNTTPKNWEIDKDAGDSTTNDGEFITFNDIETFNSPQDFTFSIWFEFTSFTNTNSDHDIITKGSHAQNRPILVWYDAAVNGTLPQFGGGNTQTISFMVTDTDGVDHWIAAPSISITTGQIYNLVVQKRGSDDTHPDHGQSRIWINGVKKADHTQSTTDGIKNTTDPLKIGAPTSTSQDSDMKIYAFHAYDSFLTDAQIDQNWNHLKDRFGL